MITPIPRYQVIADGMGSLANEHFVNGLHVHIEVLNADERVRALNAVRTWLPLLLALSANSPFWHGEDSGFASWRSVHLRRLSTMGCPPKFHDRADYEARIDRIIQLGAAVDRASISWAARLSENYDTVEVRVFDVQLCVDDALLLAGLTRSLIAEQPATVPQSSEAIGAALWVAAREGTSGLIINPLTGEIAPVWEVGACLVDALGNALTAHGDQSLVEDRMALLKNEGTGAERQRHAAMRGGRAGLRRLLVDSLTDPH